MINFECRHCGEPVEVDDTFAGRKGRCPGCGRVVTIPQTSGAVPVEAGGESAATAPADASPDGGPASPAPGESALAGADEHEGHGPRQMAVPESIQNVTLQPPEESPRSTVPTLATAAVIMAALPVLSVGGIVAGAVVHSRLRRGELGPTRRRARTAIILGTLVTLVTIIGTISLWTMVFIEAGRMEVRTQCRDLMLQLHYDIASYATSEGKYPDSLADLPGSGMMFSHGYGFHDPFTCPACERRFAYVRGLKYGTATREILLHDAVPTHGFSTLLAHSPEGRNVLWTDGTAEFLDEETFQKEMNSQRGPAVRPPGAGASSP